MFFTANSNQMSLYDLFVHKKDCACLSLVVACVSFLVSPERTRFVNLKNNDHAGVTVPKRLLLQ